MLHASADNTHVNINVKHTKGRRRCRRRGGLEREPFLVARYPGHRLRMAKGLGQGNWKGNRLGVGHAIGLGIEQGSGGSGGGCRSLSHKWRSFCGDYLAAFATKR